MSFDIYQHVTQTIVDAIEANPAEMQMPWHRFGGQLPENAVSGKQYQGVNILSLWCVAQLRGFDEAQWGTYKQWKEAGCQVRKGEKSSLIVFYKAVRYEDDQGEEQTRHVIKWSAVFNACQVDGYEAPTRPEMSPLERLEAVDAFVQSTGATIKEGGGRACYVPSLDEIHMPDGDRFFDTETRSRTEAFYGVLSHELTHWTGAPHRLARDLTGRFGSDRYAMEELVAELGAAFLCAKLSITPEVRDDHASYLANWLDVLKRDKKAIFTAAARAQDAVEYLSPS
ncbi:ArdC family protein [Amorphus orientalis]|uniref:Antirestriction protein ArdC n=1 Tax=Amorphus orientalis TaxID=649198 RepID=A0AAE3VQN5_9HYPH|nr:zincin-like metallopeptidase domain-containing protein [Amorphus orientalis]MDQ0316415.1 antirestriction protein ArdC [Amorphus orientalis]